jgi:N-acetyl-alpha-D-glucosaminyl L-malate synthase BshA
MVGETISLLSRPAHPDSRRPLRIGLLCHRGIGGSVRMAIELGTELARRGCAVHIFARAAPMGMKAPPGVKFHTLRKAGHESPVTARLDLRWSRADLDDMVACITAAVEIEQLDVLHFHYAVPFADVLDMVGRAMGRRAPALIGTLHGTDVSVFGRRPGSRAALAPALQRLDAITTVSRSHAALAVGAFNLRSAPRVIPNFVDTDRFWPRHDSGNAASPPKIIHVSNFRPVKQPESMARIFVEVRRRLDAVLWLVGDGSGMPSVQACLQRAGVDGDVRYFGLRTDVENIVREADVLVVTSRTESFCLAALEAAASGVPVVAPRLGGLPEVVADNETGLLFDPASERAAADAIVRLLGNPSLRARMGRNSVKRAQDLSAAAIVPRYLQLYRETIGLCERETLVQYSE